jgi:hypothetical protein
MLINSSNRITYRGLRLCLLSILISLIIGMPTTYATNTNSPINQQGQANCPPNETEVIIWPTMQSVIPSTPYAGDEIVIRGFGGYIQCSGGLYNESARSFGVTFDGQAIGQLGCYANYCQTRITIPPTTTPGLHIIATEGGSQLSIDVQQERLIQKVMFLPIVAHGSLE